MFGLAGLFALFLTATAVVSVPNDGSVPPLSHGRRVPRQATRRSILDRAEVLRERASRTADGKRVLVARQSQKVYPTCNSNSDVDYLPSSGYVQFPGYTIARTTSFNIVGGFSGGFNSAASCAQGCNEYDGCTGFYWGQSGNTCTFRKGNPSGTAFSTRSGGVLALQGSCASLESQINDPTIMSKCCNNPPPSSLTKCTATVYQGLGPWGVGGQRGLSGNLISAARGGALTVTGSTNKDKYAACISNCVSFLTTNTNANNGSTVGCTAAVYDGNLSIDKVHNCFLYGGESKGMTTVVNSQLVAFVQGTCQFRSDNNIAPGGCCDSNA